MTTTMLRDELTTMLNAAILHWQPLYAGSRRPLGHEATNTTQQRCYTTTSRRKTTLWHHSLQRYRSICPIRPITCMYSVIHKTGNTWRVATPLDEDRVTAVIGNMRKNLVKITRVVPEICSRTDKRTDRHAHRNNPLLHRVRSPRYHKYKWTRHGVQSVKCRRLVTREITFQDWPQGSDWRTIKGNLLIGKVKSAIAHEERRRGAHLPSLGR